MLELSARIAQIKPSPTIAVTTKANEMKAAGKDIIGLGAGEPDFDTPQFIKDAAIVAINKGQTKYTAVGGTPTLKKAVIAKFKRDQNLDYKTNQVTVSSGGKQSVFNVVLSTINPGDEVIIPAPYWVSYPDIVLIADGKPIIINAGFEQNFKITPNQLEKAITDKTRMLILNSPSNPTGVMYSKDELKVLGEILLKHPKIVVAVDDMYEHIILGEQKFVNILEATPKLFDQTVILNGVSKSYSMTGWRIGYAAGPAHIISAMENLQSQSTSNPCSISQAAAEAALNGDQSCIQPMLTAFRERHEFVVKSFNAMNGVRCARADGAFYSFPDFSEAIKTLHKNGKIKAENDLALTEYLLDFGVAVVPGSAFGAEGCIRISFATSMENLQKAMERINKALS